MACVLCLGCAAPCPLLPPTSPKPECYPRHLVSSEVSRQVLSLIGINFRSSSSLIKIINRAATKGYGDFLTMPNRDLFEPVSRWGTVSSSMIFGYWVGPDAEDGWGYIEAAVNPVFC